jgi:hypothetical protein
MGERIKAILKSSVKSQAKGKEQTPLFYMGKEYDFFAAESTQASSPDDEKIRQRHFSLRSFKLWLRQCL